MCLPVLALTAAQTMMLTIGLNVAQYYQGEQQRKANRTSATQSLTVSRQTEAIGQTEEMIAAEIERDSIRRKTRLGQGQLAAIGAARGTGASASLSAQYNEWGSREGQYQSAITAKRDQQALAGTVRDAGFVSNWQGRMMQNKSQGLAGLALAVGQGYLQASMLSGQMPNMFGATQGASVASASMTSIPGMGAFPTGSMGLSDQFLYGSGAQTFPYGGF